MATAIAAWQWQSETVAVPMLLKISWHMKKSLSTSGHLQVVHQIGIYTCLLTRLFTTQPHCHKWNGLPKLHQLKARQLSTANWDTHKASRGQIFHKNFRHFTHGLIVHQWCSFFVYFFIVSCIKNILWWLLLFGTLHLWRMHSGDLRQSWYPSVEMSALRVGGSGIICLSVCFLFYMCWKCSLLCNGVWGVKL